MRKRKKQTTNYWIVLTVDTDGSVVKKPFEPIAWPFDVTDVTGDVNGAVHLLRLGAPVKCVNDDGFLSDVRNLYARVIESGQLPSIQSVSMYCTCGWVGELSECEPDVDGDGSPGCPTCNAVVKEQQFSLQAENRRTSSDVDKP